MSKIPYLTPKQQILAAQNLSVVECVIRRHIIVNEHIYGFEYDDLFGEGCILLCKAASSYDENRGKFSTYAKRVVKNGLISYCRSMVRKQSRQRLLLDETMKGSDISYALLLPDESDAEDWEHRFSMYHTLALLNDVHNTYTGTAQLGIEALMLKISGLSGKQIAQLYGVKPNLVGAWISRAADRLKKDKRFLDWYSS